jgi:hypothetical protein
VRGLGCESKKIKNGGKSSTWSKLVMS